MFRGTKIVPKTIQKVVSKVFKVITVFWCASEPQEIDFLANRASTWPQVKSASPPNLGPKSVQNRFQNGLPREVGSGADLGTILVRFWDDFGTILGTIFGLFLV